MSKAKQDRLIEHFVAGTTARCAADLVDVNFKTAAFFYHRLMMIIYNSPQDEAHFDGEVEANESYFGGYRKVRSRKWCGSQNTSTEVAKRRGRVYA